MSFTLFIWLIVGICILSIIIFLVQYLVSFLEAFFESSCQKAKRVMELAGFEPVIPSPDKEGPYIVIEDEEMNIYCYRREELQDVGPFIKLVQKTGCNCWSKW